MIGLVVLMAAWFIAPQEGNQPVGYNDMAGYATACVGHKGADVVVGKRYTTEQCGEWLKSDIASASEGVSACIAAPMTSYQWAAFTDTAFNIGVGAFCRSSMARYANAGDMQAACKAIELYVYAGGKKVPGLIIRRAQERSLCEGKT